MYRYRKFDVLYMVFFNWPVFLLTIVNIIMISQECVDTFILLYIQTQSLFISQIYFLFRPD